MRQCWINLFFLQIPATEALLPARYDAVVSPVLCRKTQATPGLNLVQTPAWVAVQRYACHSVILNWPWMWGTQSTSKNWVAQKNRKVLYPNPQLMSFCTLMAEVLAFRKEKVKITDRHEKHIFLGFFLFFCCVCVCVRLYFRQLKLSLVIFKRWLYIVVLLVCFPHGSLIYTNWKVGGSIIFLGQILNPESLARSIHKSLSFYVNIRKHLGMDKHTLCN